MIDLIDAVPAELPPKNAAPDDPHGILRANLLYDRAQELELLCPTQSGKDIARSIRLLALEILAEARARGQR